MTSRFLAALAAQFVLAASLAFMAASPTPADAQQKKCHPAYSGDCVPVGMGDVNCGDLKYQVRLRNPRVDPFELDDNADPDIIGCESNEPAPPGLNPVTLAKKPAATRPVGKSFKIAKVGTSNVVVATGWALDPDVKRPSRVRVLVDGKARKTVKAKGTLKQAPKRYTSHGTNHRFQVKVKVGKGQHKVCVVALNEGRPAKARRLKCKTITI